MKIFWIILILVVAGCAVEEPQPKIEAAQCGECICDCECDCGCACSMEDLDFFGVYYAACVQLAEDLKALYSRCGVRGVVDDPKVCVWQWWNGSMPLAVCSSRVKQISEAIKAGTECDRLRAELGPCEFGLLPQE